MAKKKQRAHQVSKGEGSNVSKSLINAVRREMSGAEKMVNKVKAWRKGQNPWITIDNPNPNETNKRRIRVKANSYFGSYRKVLNKKSSEQTGDSDIHDIE